MRYRDFVMCGLGGVVLLGLSAELVQAQVRGSAPPVAAVAPGSFDGTWLVLFTCIAARDGAAGYSYQFLASVRNGVLQGNRGIPGQPGSLSLDGTIQADGSAMLSAQGRTGAPDYSVGRVAPGNPVSFHLQSRFAGSHGTGTRIELRPCEAVFTKQ